MTHEIPIEVDCLAVAAKLRAGGRFALVDCREPDEYAIARIGGARLVPVGELAARLAELEPYRDCPLVVHCHHGGRSLKAALWLRQQGFAQAQSMRGGIDEWSRVVDPTVPRY